MTRRTRDMCRKPHGKAASDASAESVLDVPPRYQRASTDMLRDAVELALCAGGLGEAHTTDCL
eukprot:4973579-Amphidinium_carterae.1